MGPLLYAAWLGGVAAVALQVLWELQGPLPEVVRHVREEYPPIYWSLLVLLVLFWPLTLPLQVARRFTGA